MTDTNFNDELLEEQKQFTRNWMISISSILLFFSFIYYHVGFNTISYLTIAAFVIIAYHYVMLKLFPIGFYKQVGLAIFILSIFLYIITIYQWKYFPSTYIWFLTIPIPLLYVWSFKVSVKWSLTIIVFASTAPFVSKILNMKYDFVFPENISLLINTSTIIFNVYLVLFFLYYFIQFQKYKSTETAPLKTNEIADNYTYTKDVINENTEPEITEENIEEEIDTVKEIGISEEKLNELTTSIEIFFKEKRPYTDPDFSLNKLASQLNTNITYVSRALKHCKNVSFKTYLNSYRIADIKEKFNKQEHKKYTLKHLYSSVGFTHQTTFNRVFKEVEGLTPTEYIERLG